MADNIGFGLRVRHVNKDAIRRKVAEMLGLIHLEGKGGQYPYELSGGMQQRVALARALAIEPRVLLLDEPLSALDAKIRVALRQEIRSIQRQLGITTVYVTHDQEEALSLSDTIVVMSEGRVEQIGSPAEVYGTPATPFVARFVGQLSVLTGRVADSAGGRVAVGSQVIELGRSLEGHPTGSQRRPCPSGPRPSRSRHRRCPAATHGDDPRPPVPGTGHPDPAHPRRGRAAT